MAGNPLVDQGVLNRLLGSVNINDFPELNVTAPFLGEAGISLALDGETSLALPTLTGVAQSPEPYQILTVSMALLKTQALSAQYKAKVELNSLIGNIVITPDAQTLPKYFGVNCAIANVREMSMGGRDPVMMVTIKGIYYINSNLWNL